MYSQVFGSLQYILGSFKYIKANKHWTGKLQFYIAWTYEPKHFHFFFTGRQNTNIVRSVWMKLTQYLILRVITLVQMIFL